MSENEKLLHEIVYNVHHTKVATKSYIVDTMVTEHEVPKDVAIKVFDKCLKKESLFGSNVKGYFSVNDPNFSGGKSILKSRLGRIDWNMVGAISGIILGIITITISIYSAKFPNNNASFDKKESQHYNDTRK